MFITKFLIFLIWNVNLNHKHKLFPYLDSYLNIGTNNTFSICSIEMPQKSRSRKRRSARLLRTRMSQMVMCPNPLDGASLLLLFQQRVCAKIRGLMNRWRVWFAQRSSRKMFRHRLLYILNRSTNSWRIFWRFRSDFRPSGFGTRSSKNLLSCWKRMIWRGWT